MTLKSSPCAQVSKRGRLLYVSHKQSHLKYEQLNTLRDQNKNTHVVVYRRYASGYAATFSLSTHLLDTCVSHGCNGTSHCFAFFLYAYPESFFVTTCQRHLRFLSSEGSNNKMFLYFYFACLCSTPMCCSMPVGVICPLPLS